MPDFANISTPRAHAALAGDAERLRIATETAQLGVWELNLETEEMTASDICKANFGRAPHEAFSYDDLIAAIHPDDQAVRQKAVREAARSGSIYRSEYRILWPDGSVHWIVASGRTLFEDEDKPMRIFGVTLDVTDRHLAASALVQSEKLAAVGRMASAIAHEMNNPLEAVTNLLFIARGTNDPAEIHAYLDQAELELRRVSAISNQTLRFHKQSSNAKAVSGEELFDEVLTVFQGRRLNQQIVVERRERAETPVVCFDGEIRQVLNNLVGNAVDAMPFPGGRLLLRSREGTDWKTGRKGLVLTVGDTGTGIPAGQLKKIFDPFFSTKGIGGTGLGLWVSQDIVARHKGAMRVRSRSRQGAAEKSWGSVFTLFLPFETAAR